jgi:hypothetical protein
VRSDIRPTLIRLWGPLDVASVICQPCEGRHLQLRTRAKFQHLCNRTGLDELLALEARVREKTSRVRKSDQDSEEHGAAFHGLRASHPTRLTQSRVSMRCYAGHALDWQATQA